MTTSPSTKYADVRGLRMAYREGGSGRPLVLVHGNYGSKRWFEELLTDPLPGRHLVAPDLPNFAESDTMPEPIDIETYGEYLVSFCDKLGLEEFALLGHSLGGAVVQSVAVNHPERVERLLLLASASPAGHATPEEHYALLEAFKGNRDLLAQALAGTVPSGKPSYFEGLVDDALAMRHEAFVGNGRALHSFDVSDRTGNYRGPVLVIRGEHDLPHLISEEIATRTAQAYENGRLELWDGVGHSPQVESPDRFRRALIDFLEEPAMR